MAARIAIPAVPVFPSSSSVSSYNGNIYILRNLYFLTFKHRHGNLENVPPFLKTTTGIGGQLVRRSSDVLGM